MISSTIHLGNLENYADQEIPEYITLDNTGDNAITDPGATLGRVLFYDKNLSTDKTIACASCHHQEFAFSDTSFVSQGVNGVTGRHSMRLVNARFSGEERFFWDERASTLEEQTSQPIQDHAEMGYSGIDGNPGIEDLILELSDIDYYQQLFAFVYGDSEITEERIQLALAQFIRSIQSFDSKYDIGRAEVDGELVQFPNFTPSENRGKRLFNQDPTFDASGNRIDGGLGCASCHVPPEFSIDPESRNNGIVNEVNGGANFQINRAPTLRDMFSPVTGDLNGPLMHNGRFDRIRGVIQHYNRIGDLPQFVIELLDPRLRSLSNGQMLNLTDQETDDLVRFLHTLTGSDVYTDPKWSDPFDENGDILVLDEFTSVNDVDVEQIKIYPNPASDYISIDVDEEIESIEILDLSGRVVLEVNGMQSTKNKRVDISQLQGGVYLVRTHTAGKITLGKVVVQP